MVFGLGISKLKSISYEFNMVKGPSFGMRTPAINAPATNAETDPDRLLQMWMVYYNRKEEAWTSRVADPSPM